MHPGSWEGSDRGPFLVGGGRVARGRCPQSVPFVICRLDRGSVARTWAWWLFQVSLVDYRASHDDPSPTGSSRADGLDGVPPGAESFCTVGNKTAKLASCTGMIAINDPSRQRKRASNMPASPWIAMDGMKTCVRHWGPPYPSTLTAAT